MLVISVNPACVSVSVCGAAYLRVQLVHYEVTQ